MSEKIRLDDMHGFSTTAFDGKVHVDLWAASRTAGADPMRFELTPKQALEFGLKLIGASRDVLANILAG